MHAPLFHSATSHCPLPFVLFSSLAPSFFLICVGNFLVSSLLPQTFALRVSTLFSIQYSFPSFSYTFYYISLSSPFVFHFVSSLYLIHFSVFSDTLLFLSFTLPGSPVLFFLSFLFLTRWTLVGSSPFLLFSHSSWSFFLPFLIFHSYFYSLPKHLTFLPASIYFSFYITFICSNLQFSLLSLPLLATVFHSFYLHVFFLFLITLLYFPTFFAFMCSHMSRSLPLPCPVFLYSSYVHPTFPFHLFIFYISIFFSPFIHFPCLLFIVFTSLTILLCFVFVSMRPSFPLHPHSSACIFFLFMPPKLTYTQFSSHSNHPRTLSNLPCPLVFSSFCLLPFHDSLFIFFSFN